MTQFKEKFGKLVFGLRRDKPLTSLLVHANSLYLYYTISADIVKIKIWNILYFSV